MGPSTGSGGGRWRVRGQQAGRPAVEPLAALDQTTSARALEPEAAPFGHRPGWPIANQGLPADALQPELLEAPSAQSRDCSGRDAPTPGLARDPVADLGCPVCQLPQAGGPEQCTAPRVEHTEVEALPARPPAGRRPLDPLPRHLRGIRVGQHRPAQDICVRARPDQRSGVRRLPRAEVHIAGCQRQRASRNVRAGHATSMGRNLTAGERVPMGGEGRSPTPTIDTGPSKAARSLD